MQDPTDKYSQQAATNLAAFMQETHQAGEDILKRLRQLKRVEIPPGSVKKHWHGVEKTPLANALEDRRLLNARIAYWQERQNTQLMISLENNLLTHINKLWHEIYQRRCERERAPLMEKHLLKLLERQEVLINKLRAEAAAERAAHSSERTPTKEPKLDLMAHFMGLLSKSQTQTPASSAEEVSNG